jgi:hypothetical protein
MQKWTSSSFTGDSVPSPDVVNGTMVPWQLPAGTESKEFLTFSLGKAKFISCRRVPSPRREAPKRDRSPKPFVRRGYEAL